MSMTDQVSTKGWSWGVAEFSSDSMIMKDSEGLEILSVAANDVQQAVSLGKGEFVVEFQQDYTRDKSDEYLVEMRFQIPDENVLTMVKDKMVEISGVSAGGESIALVDEVPFMIPRGHHDI